MATFAYTPRAMNMRAFVISGLSLAILVACGGPVTRDYRLTFDTQDPGEVEMFTKATVRVIQRRLERLDAQLFAQHTVQDADGATLELTISSSDGANALAEEMAAPFDLDIMAEAPAGASGDIVVEGFGAFVATGVTGEDIQIVTTVGKETGGAIVQIRFTDTGLTEMQELFRNNVGKRLGLFVRGKLVSALTIADATLPNPLLIDGVPDLELANIFADDVNVGLHVTVTPL